MSEKKETIYAVQLDLIMRTSTGKEIRIIRDLETDDDIEVKPSTHSDYGANIRISETIMRALVREIKNLKKVEVVFPKPEAEEEEAE